MQRLLIVHPDASTRSLMASMLQSSGHLLEEAANDRTAVRMLEQTPYQLAMIGLEPSSAEALELLGLLRRKHPRTAVLVFSTTLGPEASREFLQRGAGGFFRFPLPAAQLRASVAQALPLEPAAAGRTNGRIVGEPTAAAVARPTPIPGWSTPSRDEAPSPLPADADPAAAAARAPSIRYRLLGNDPVLRQVVELAEAIAPLRSPVLILGEAGTGKVLLARQIHEASRRDGEFVTLCLDHHDDDFEQSLLGAVHDGQHEPGLLARAAGGTLYIDDVAGLDANQQALLHRVLRDGEYRPIGSDTPLRVACRIIAGSSQEVGPMAESGQFRSDLHYALSGVTLNLPPLRHRGQDILLLAEHFRETFARAHGRTLYGISPEAGRRLAGHDWPMNVSELKAVIERAVLRCRGPWIEANLLDLENPVPTGREAASGVARKSTPILPLKEALEQPEKQLILEALRALNWNRQETARVLDINRTTLYKKMKKYGLIFEEPAWAN
jgi:two-component system response regulator HydG